MRGERIGHGAAKLIHPRVAGQDEEGNINRSRDASAPELCLILP